MLRLMGSVPFRVRWLFWDVDAQALDTERHADFVLARVLEFGRMADVRWAMSRYGLERIHSFFRDVGHPEIGDRTLEFWRAVLSARDEPWASPPDWRKSSSAPWVA
jgi:hypothetical protein